MDRGNVVQRPQFNPFKAALAEERLPRGRRIAFMLGMGESSPQGRRVVAGEVCGYAVRSARYIDVGLRGIQTWRYGAAIREVDGLPEPAEAYFRVAVQGSIPETLDALRQSRPEGRSILPAVEIPYGACPTCATTIETRYPFCRNCGTRVGLGWHYSRSSKPPRRSEKGAYCPGCWLRHEESGRFCVYCGFDRTLQSSLATLSGMRAAVLLTTERRRGARLECTILRADFKRIYRSSGPQLVVRVTNIELANTAAGDPALPADFSTWLVISLLDGSVERTAEALLAGEEVRGSEVTGPCSACNDSERRSAKVRNRFCAMCGSRQRILPLQEERASPSRRKRHGVTRHSCGQAIGVNDRYCGSCGEEIPLLEEMTDLSGRRGVWASLASASIDGIASDVDPSFSL